jgi:cardiolipin synthase A/B
MRTQLERNRSGFLTRLRSTAGAGLLAIAAAACGHVQPHLVLPTLEVGDPTFAATITGYTEAPVVGGNRIDVLLNGDEIFPAKLKIINAATKTINYAQYVFEEGQPADDVARALAERCRAGVQVNVLVDAVGAMAMPAEQSRLMTEAGCRVETFRRLGPFTLDSANYRNHRRILVADGRIGITGGSGTSGKWSGNGRTDGHWRDTDVLVEGPVVAQLQGAFVENWLEATGVALGGDDYFPRPLEARGPIRAQAVRSSPAGGSVSMYTMFLLAVASAQRSIHITNPYFVPDDKMIETLVQVAHRGVRVVLILPGAIDHNLVRQASRSELGRLLRAGIEVYEYRAALLHSKTMVIDGVWSTVGSTNLDRRSFALNDELNLVIYDQAVARRLDEIFAQDLALSRRVTYEDWRRRGFVGRLLELLAVPIKSQM